VLATYKQAVMLGSLSHLHGVSSCVQVSDQVLNKLVTEELNKAIFRQILHGGNGKHGQWIYKLQITGQSTVLHKFADLSGFNNFHAFVHS
jgi:hypothetical protein